MLVRKVNSESKVMVEPLAAQVENSYKLPAVTLTKAYSPPKLQPFTSVHAAVGVTAPDG